MSMQFVLPLLLLTRGNTLTMETTCSMPSVEQGETTNLTCNFGVDMNSVKHDIFIQRYVGNSSNREPVMDCYWKEAHENYTCKPSPPFILSGNITDFLILQLPSAEAKDKGSYYCEVIEEAFAYQSCKFTTLHTANFFNVKTGGKSQNTGTAESEKATKIGVGVGVSVLVLVGICVGTLLLCRKRRSKRLATNQNGTALESGTPAKEARSDAVKYSELPKEVEEKPTAVECEEE